VTTHTVPVDLDGERVDKIVAVLGGLSRSEARSLVDAGGVESEGAQLAAKDRLGSGSEIVFETPDPVEVLQPESVEFGVRFEDEHLIVVDKPAHLVVHPGAGRTTGTLASGLLDRYPELRGVGESPRWGIVHRLDRDTSGLMVVARTSQAHRLLTGMIKRREVERRYSCLVDGIFDAPRGTVDAPIGPDPSRPRRRVVTPFGKESRTHYRLNGQWTSMNAALLDVTLETGRTHQIRVHLAAIDHPVVGDHWYGRPTRVQSARVFLHAAGLAFDHPVSGGRVTFESPLPTDLASVLESLGEAD
jgi:23S rRNA pseudouridine1911/1915/1917 synthase